MESAAAHTPEHRAPGCGHKRKAVGACVYPRTHAGKVFVEAHPGHIVVSQTSDRELVGVGALGFEVVSKPIYLARRVVVDLVKTERLEPARGSWAQIS